MLKVGINWLSPYTLPTVQRLLNEGIADFCEVMVDNAVHLPPAKILAALPNAPIALHIVTSGFLTKSVAELKEMALHLRSWIADLRPIYVSEHLTQLNYSADYANTCERLKIWQALLGTPLLIENDASMSVGGVGQAEFYAKLIEETKCKLLFDFSNAYIAEYNGAQLSEAWQPLIEHAAHFHIAGFRIDPITKLAYDTHDQPIADEVLMMMRQGFLAEEDKHRTIVVEFDTNLTYEVAKEQVARVRS